MIYITSDTHGASPYRRTGERVQVLFEEVVTP